MPPGADGREPTELRTAPFITGRGLVIAWVAIGWVPVICVREVLLTAQPFDEIVQLLAVSALGIFLLGWLTHSWLAQRRYGVSVCRLVAPVVIGESFDVEIECALPLDTGEPVIARFSNKAARGKALLQIWQAELRIDSGTIAPRGAGRVAVPVRLRAPEWSEVAPGLPGRAGFGALWVLELMRKTRGIDFHAEFALPVRDAEGAAEEQAGAG